MSKYEVINLTMINEGYDMSEYRSGTFDTEEEALNHINTLINIDKTLGISNDYEVNEYEC